MKTKNEPNNHFAKFEHSERLRHNVTCQIDTRHKKRKTQAESLTELAVFCSIALRLLQ